MFSIKSLFVTKNGGKLNFLTNLFWRITQLFFVLNLVAFLSEAVKQKTINNDNQYVITWFFVFSVAYIFRRKIVGKIKKIGSPFLRFFVISLFFIAIEEILAYATRTGAFEGVTENIWAGFLILIPGFVALTLSWYPLLRRYSFLHREVFLLYGLVGWFVEVIWAGRFVFIGPIFSLFIFPYILFAYLPFVYFALLSIHDECMSTKRSRLQLFLAIIVPGFSFVIVTRLMIALLQLLL